MQTLRKYAFTFFILAWDWSKRLRGSWRRREWDYLIRQAMGVANIILLCVWVAILLRG